tara:strand:+ start:666 stop:1010 length:345 start_codon:yes stop_codon:yes gene_type:complete
MFIDFVDNHLDHIRWANEKEQKEFWQVEGIIKKYSNQLLKFDVSFLKEYPDDKVGKRITRKTKSDKIVIATTKNWVILDTKEVIDYVINLQLKEVRLEELIDKLKCNTLIKMKD